MESKTLFWLVIISCIILIALNDWIREKLDRKFLLRIARGTYIRLILFVGVVLILYVAHNDYERKGMIEGRNDTHESYRVKFAFQKAKESVSNILKSPSTADFADEYDKASKYKINEDGSVTIQSYVDAENSFGAKIRTNYRCKVSSSGEVSDIDTW